MFSSSSKLLIQSLPVLIGKAEAQRRLNDLLGVKIRRWQAWEQIPLSPQTPTYLDLPLYFACVHVNSARSSALRQEREISALQIFCQRILTLSPPLPALVKAVGRNQIYEEFPEGFIVPLFITELPNLVKGHVEEGSVGVRLYWDSIRLHQIRLDWCVNNGKALRAGSGRPHPVFRGSWDQQLPICDRTASGGGAFRNVLVQKPLVK